MEISGEPLLFNKVAVITGGGRGIGKAIALAFARQGARLAINYSQNSRQAQQTANETEHLGAQIMLVRADVSKKSDVQNMTTNILERFKRIDVLVNNAGIGTMCPFEQFSEEAWDRDIDVDLKGVFLCSQIMGQQMIRQRDGNIINISSTAAETGIPKISAYCAAKAGVNALTKVLSIEWARHNIRVNGIAPGFTKTEMMEELVKTGLRSRGEQERIERRIPLGRCAEPSEIAELAVFLASRKSAYITGETIYIDGGWRAYGYV